jgi:hypothetical protein
MPLVMIKSDARAREKPCIRCGYSLRKIDSTHCPECGLSVWLSLNQNDSLEWSSASWLRRMVRGLWLMAGAQVLAMAAYGLVLMQKVPEMQYHQRQEQAAESLEMTDDPAKVAATMATLGPPPLPNYVFQRTAIILGAGYLLLYHAGMLLLVWNEKRYPDRLAHIRTFAWIVCGAAGFMSLAMAVWAVSPDTFWIVGVGLKLVVLTSGIVTWAYLRRLAKRVPNSTLAKTCGWLMLVPAISFLKVFPFFSFFLIGFLWSLIEFVPLIYVPLSAVLLVWFSILFNKAAVSADHSWASETAITR